MKFYYRNPKTENLMIYDSDENELLIVEKVKSVRFFTESDLKTPIQDVRFSEVGGGNTKRKTGKRAVITPEIIDKIKQQRGEGISAYKIAKELGISPSSVYKQE